VQENPVEKEYTFGMLAAIVFLQLRAVIPARLSPSDFLECQRRDTGLAAIGEFEFAANRQPEHWSVNSSNSHSFHIFQRFFIHLVILLRKTAKYNFFD
jgi:hypothetical protein